MSISGAFNAAVSGLQTMSRAAAGVATNVANASTDGFGRRELVLSSREIGEGAGGVAIRSTERQIDDGIVADRRLADARVADLDARAAMFTDIQFAIGEPSDATSLPARISAFEGALAEAASRPDAETRLEAVVRSAKRVTEKLGDIAAAIRDARSAADADIARQVDRLNSGLRRIDDLNERIFLYEKTGRDPNALKDRRQVEIDALATIAPIRMVDRPGGRVALFTTTGLALLDDRPAEFTFDDTPVVAADMRVEDGDLGQVMLDGRAVPIGGDRSFMTGGSLAAAFAIRDDVAAPIQDSLDGLARDLIQRFEDPGLDPTLAAGAAGFFTDDGAPLNPADTVGLSSRLTLSPLIDPEAGGEVWRVRDGLAAAVQGDAGDARLILAMGDRLSETRLPAQGSFDIAKSFHGLAAEILSAVSGGRTLAEEDGTANRVLRDELKIAEMASGVDTDQEMQDLLRIESAYAANAKVLQALDEMLLQVLRI